MNTMSSLMCISVFRWIVMYDQVRTGVMRSRLSYILLWCRDIHSQTTLAPRCPWWSCSAGATACSCLCRPWLDGAGLHQKSVGRAAPQTGGEQRTSHTTYSSSLPASSSLWAWYWWAPSQWRGYSDKQHEVLSAQRSKRLLSGDSTTYWGW